MSTVAVVGAGVFGAWSALRLAEAGDRVTLVDAYGPANGRASSADRSRIVRAGYGGEAIYSRWASESLRDWTWLTSETGRSLYTRTGALFLGKPDHAYIRASYDTLVTLGLRAEWLDPSALAARYPQIALDGLGPALFEHDAGVLEARAAVHAVVDLGVARGVTIRRARLAPLDETASSPVLRLADGSVLEAEIYVLACGPWLPGLLPLAVGSRIRPTQQEVLYFGVPAGDTRFSAPACPVWIDFEAGVYGVPDLAAHGFKVGIDRHGPPIDPDTAERLVSREIVARTRDGMARRFPGLAHAPLVDSRVCQYENTATGDFLIDRHPLWRNVWIVGGGSGHGFKHGPAIGRHVAALVTGVAQPEARWALNAHARSPARAVY